MSKHYQPVSPHELLKGLSELEEQGVKLPKAKETILQEVILNTQKSYVGYGKNIQPFNAKLAKDKAQKALNKRLHKTDSEILRQNMLNAGRSIPKGADAHHIVPSKENRPWARQYANEARAILKRWGIPINCEANGVALPTSSKNPVASIPNAYFHKKVHTKVYYMNIADSLSGSRSKKDCISILREIGEDLEDGIYPIR